MGMFGDPIGDLAHRITLQSITPDMLMPSETPEQAAAVALRSAQEALAEIDGAIKGSRSLVVGMINATCHPESLKRGAVRRSERLKGKYTEAYAPHPVPAVAEANVQREMAAFFGTQIKRSARYSRWERLPEKDRLRAKRPTAPMYRVGGNPIIKALVEMEEVRDFANELGIGPESTKAQRDEIQADPDIAPLLARRAAPAAFGDPNAVYPQYPDYFVPQEEDDSYAHFQEAGAYDAAGQFDPGMLYTPPVQQPQQSLAQKAYSFVRSFVNSKAGSIVCATICTFMVYLATCAVLSWAFPGKWWFCSLYETVMDTLRPVWKQQVSKSQVKSIVVDYIKKSEYYTRLYNSYDKDNVLENVNRILSRNDNYNKLTTLQQEISAVLGTNAARGESLSNAFNSFAFDETSIWDNIDNEHINKENLQEGFAASINDGFKSISDDWMMESVRNNDALLEYVPQSVRTIAENPVAMAGVYTGLVSAVFFYCIGARKRFVITPLAVIVISVGATALGVDKKLATDTVNGLGFHRDGVSYALLLTAINAAMAGIVRWSSGAAPGEAIANAAAAMAGGVQADVTRRQMEMRMRDRMRASFYNDPYVVGASEVWEKMPTWNTVKDWWNKKA
jgi:hypothetical protein